MALCRSIVEKGGAVGIVHGTEPALVQGDRQAARVAASQRMDPDPRLTDVGNLILRMERTQAAQVEALQDAGVLFPVIVMTGDANPAKQAELLREGANDLVLKPTEERLLLTKVLFQLRAAARAPQTAAAVDSPASP